MAISSPYPAQRGFFHVSESDTLLLLAQRIPAAASPRKKTYEKTSDAYPLPPSEGGCSLYRRHLLCQHLFSALQFYQIATAFFVAEFAIEPSFVTARWAIPLYYLFWCTHLFGYLANCAISQIFVPFIECVNFIFVISFTLVLDGFFKHITKLLTFRVWYGIFGFWMLWLGI